MRQLKNAKPSHWLDIQEDDMDVSSFNMHKKSRFSFFQYEVQTLKSTLARRLVGIAAASMVMLPSSLVHADDLADLIRKKS